MPTPLLLLHCVNHKKSILESFFLLLLPCSLSSLLLLYPFQIRDLYLINVSLLHLQQKLVGLRSPCASERVFVVQKNPLIWNRGAPKAVDRYDEKARWVSFRGRKTRSICYTVKDNAYFGGVWRLFRRVLWEEGEGRRSGEGLRRPGEPQHEKV